MVPKRVMPRWRWFGSTLILLLTCALVVALQAAAQECGDPPQPGCGCVEGTSLPCGTNVGVCEFGVEQCVNGYLTPCSGGTGPNTTEPDEGLAGLCNGLDDNCNGVPDEGCACVPPASRPCGSATGACENGVQDCIGGVWTACSGGTGPEDEICDGQDNDCDGMADEGTCAGHGECDSQGAVCTCDEGYTAQSGTCVAVDLDEDGVPDVDDNCPGVANEAQADGDDDRHGDTCDNCPGRFNFWQEDSDGDQVGDACVQPVMLERARQDLEAAIALVPPEAPRSVAGKIRSASRLTAKQVEKHDPRKQCRTKKKVARIVAKIDTAMAVAGAKLAPADAVAVLAQLGSARNSAAEAQADIDGEIANTIYVSGRCDRPLKCYVNTACSADQALADAAGLDEPIIFLSRDASLASPVTQSAEFRAKRAGKIAIEGSGTAPALTVAAAPSEKVLLDGVRLVASAEGAALALTSGRLEGLDLTVEGTVSGDGVDAEAAFGGLLVEGTLPLTYGPLTDVGNCYAVDPGALCGGSYAVGATNGASLLLANATITSAVAPVGPAVYAASGGSVVMWKVTIRDVSPIGLCVEGGYASMSLSTIEDIRGDGRGQYGWGARVTTGGRLVLASTRIENTSAFGVLVDGAGSRLVTSELSKITGVLRGAEYKLGVGVHLQNGATASIKDTTISATHGGGLLVSTGAAATVANSAVINNSGFGVTVGAAGLELDGTTIAYTQHDPSVGGGVAALIRNDISGGSTVRIEDSTLYRNKIAGVYILGDAGADIDIIGSDISYTEPQVRASFALNGNAVFATGLCSQPSPADTLTLLDNTFADNIGYHVMLDAANAWATHNFFSNDIVAGAGDVIQQACPSCAQSFANCASDNLPQPLVCDLCPQYDDLFIDLSGICFELQETDPQE